MSFFDDFIAPNESGSQGYAAKNPLSSASGKYQMTKGFVTSLAKKYRPDLVSQYGTDRNLFDAFRLDPKLQETFKGLGDKDNATTASAAGVPYSDANKGVFWRLGAGNAMKVMSADPSTPLDKLLPQDVLSVNPDLLGRTAGDIVSGNGYVSRNGKNVSDVAKSPMQSAMGPSVDDAKALLGLQGPALGAIGGPNTVQPPTNEAVTGPSSGGDWGNSTLYNLSNAALGAGAGLSSIDNPGGAAIALSMLRDRQKEDSWDLVKAGNRLYKVNKSTGQIQPAGQAGPDSEDSFGKADSKEAAKELTNAQNDANAGTTRLQKLNELKAYTQNPDVYQGFAGGAVAALKNAGKTWGFDIQGNDETQAFRALSNQFSLSIRNPKAGEGLPGNLSDKDLAFLRQSVPSLENQPGGNQMIIDFMSKIEQNNIDYNNEKARFIEENRGRSGLSAHMEQWRNSHDILAPDGFNPKTKSFKTPGGLDITPLD